MVEQRQGVIVRAEERPRETFENALRGDVEWFTLFSAGLTPSEALTAGLMELPAGGTGLALHRHADPELYFVLEGSGLLTIEGADTTVSAGAAVFIPGDAEHGIRNAGDGVLRVLYVFATDRFSDVTYRFSADDAAGRAA